MRLMTTPDAPRIIISRGPREVERLLLEEIDRLRPRTPDELTRPVRVVVPSASLRHHVLRRIMDTTGRSVVGVVVQTMYGLALEVVDRLPGENVQLSESTHQLLIRRLAAGEATLSDALQMYDDGYGSVVGVVRDLLDAGMGPEHEEPLLDAAEDMAREVPADDLLERVRAVIRVAARTAEASGVLGVGRASTVIRQATRAIREDPDGAVPAREVLIHGWADATGVAADFLDVLMRTGRARVFLDHPPNPVEPASPDAGAAFTARLEDRLSEYGPSEERTSIGQTSRVTVVRAADRDAEAREVARSIALLIEAGQLPESVAVVARDLRQFCHHLARQFDRFGVPYSTAGVELPAGGGVGRKASALAALLTEREEVPAETWIETLPAAPHGASTADLALGLRVLGAARLGDVTEIVLEEVTDRGLELPIVDGVDEVDGEILRVRRRLPRQTLLEIVVRARRCCKVFAEWPEEAPADRHLESAQSLLRSLSGEPAESEDRFSVALSAMTDELASGWYVTQAEWILLASAALRMTALAPPGGKGGGVAMLTAMEARARTFERLFLVGCNRNTFPRTVAGDPLMPDRVRLRLGAVLRDIPIKSRGWDEERYLFAQLVASADDITVSYSDSDGGRRLVASPFVEPFRSFEEEESPPDVFSPWDPGENEVGARPAFEHAVRTALNRQSARDDALAAAVEEGLARIGDVPRVAPAKLASARGRIVAEADRWQAGFDTGPFSGHVATGAADTLRSRQLPVTLLEAIARCPWRALVERVLGVAPVPDLMMDVPEVSSLEVGQVVHDVLARIVVEQHGVGEAEFFDCLATNPVTVVWPEDLDLERMVASEAERIGRQEGMARFGAGPLLARIALPLLGLARDLDFAGPDGPPAVLGAEIKGSIVDSATGRTVTFRADRVDAGPILTDYKTGKPRPVDEIGKGLQLQASVYARAAGPDAIGRYLYLGGDAGLSNEDRELVVAGDDDELMEAANRALEVILAAWTLGVFFPRVEDAGRSGIKASCRFCSIAEACRRDDSSFRRQLVAWMGAQKGQEEHDPAERSSVAAALWWLGSKT